MRRSMSYLRIISLFVLLSCIMIHSQTQAQNDTPSTGAAPTALATDAEIEAMNEEIDWLEETKKGGMTMIVLLVLSCAGVAFVIERAWALRSVRFAPRSLAAQATALVEAGEFDGALSLCKTQSSTLAKAITFLVTHREQSYETVSLAVADIAGRDIRDQHSRTTPLAVVASLAPLLGLLGTMIGMIESFKLVSLYGDDGGASMLAGSIAKALITTAVGLIIAIPALAAYHFFKQRVAAITNAIENCIEPLMVAVLLDNRKP